MNYKIDDISEVTFWGVNIPKFVNKVMEQFEEESIKNMTEVEKKIYKLGVENALSIIDQLLEDGSDGGIAFYNPDVEEIGEFTTEDIIRWLNSKNK